MIVSRWWILCSRYVTFVDIMAYEISFVLSVHILSPHGYHRLLYNQYHLSSYCESLRLINCSHRCLLCFNTWYQSCHRTIPTDRLIGVINDLCVENLGRYWRGPPNKPPYYTYVNYSITSSTWYRLSMCGVNVLRTGGTHRRRDSDIQRRTAGTQNTQIGKEADTTGVAEFMSI